MIFRQIKVSQIKALIDHEIQASPYPWTEKMLRDSLDARADCQTIELSQNQIGYCVVQRCLDEAELLNLVIFKSFQNMGYGQKALAKIKSELASMKIKLLFLEVRRSNLAASRVYQNTGFLRIQTRKLYYRTATRLKEDAIVMCCKL